MVRDVDEHAGRAGRLSGGMEGTVQAVVADEISRVVRFLDAPAQVRQAPLLPLAYLVYDTSRV